MFCICLQSTYLEREAFHVLPAWKEDDIGCRVYCRASSANFWRVAYSSDRCPVWGSGVKRVIQGEEAGAKGFAGRSRTLR